MIKNQVLHLSSWPSLSNLSLAAVPEEAMPDIVRICALLAYRPSVGMFIPVLLQIPPPVAYSLLEMLYASGHIYGRTTIAPTEPTLCNEGTADSHEPAVMPFIFRLWERLTSSHVFA